MRNKILSILAVAALVTACETCCEEPCAPEAAAGPVPGSPEHFKASVGDRVYFAFNKSNLSPEAMRTLDGQAGWFKAYPNPKADVEGHCDKRGTREYNLALGLRRAHAVEQYLSKQGVDSARINAITFGKDRLQDPGDTPEAHARNRVAITVVK